MTVLTWDRVGERTYQAGVDRGVLYLHDGTVAVWNGLTGVDEDSTSERKAFYLDGVKYLENVIPGDFSGTLTAFTYPDEFDKVNGIGSPTPGLSYYEQPASSFNLSYRTLLGNDLEGTDLGYKIHILYNIIAELDGRSFVTFDEVAQLTEFSWNLSGVPEKIENFRPTVHISIDSVTTPPDILEMIENRLYGTDVSDPSFISMQEIAEIFGYVVGDLVIVDHGDGTWSAIDDSDTHITMISSTHFQIDDANANYLNLDAYQIYSPD
jgi:hypothetical protein